MKGAEPILRTDLGALYHGDCMELMPLIPDSSVDLILCDLPYGTVDCKWDKRIPMGPLWGEYQRIISECGWIVLTAQQPFATDLINAGRKIFRYQIIWEKNCALGFLNAKLRPLKAHEILLVFAKKPGVYNPQMTQGDPYRKYHAPGSTPLYDHCVGAVSENAGERYPRDVLRFDKDRAQGTGHPTAKPLILWEWIVKTYTNPGAVVLDNCVGSGTTACAAEKLGRRWVAMEKEAEYCDIVRRRLAETEEEIRREEEERAAEARQLKMFDDDGNIKKCLSDKDRQAAG